MTDATSSTPPEIMVLPLIVDLDRTLLKTDTLVEQFLVVLFSAPVVALRALQKLRTGKAAFKAAVIDAAPIDVDTLVLNQDLLEYLKTQKRNGRPLHLVTAADQRVADAVAERVGLFDTATGTNDNHNLKGQHKRDYLLQTFPGGFSYAGDSSADIPIWRVANSAALVGVSAETRRIVETLDCDIEIEIEGPNRSYRQWTRLLRIHQWSKNLLVFAPLFLAHLYTEPRAIFAAIVGFVAMSILASGTYVINDLSDIAADRAHRTKKFRPVASGDIDAGVAFVVAIALIVTGLCLGFLFSWQTGALLGLYLVTTLSYSLVFKKTVLVDVFILAGLYTLRLYLGVVVIGAVNSYWLLIFSFFFFLSLSLAKRHVEIVHAARKAQGDVVIPGRGYRTGDAPLTLATGISTNMVAVMVLSLYVANDAYPEAMYARPEFLWCIVAMVLVWSLRIWLLSHRGELNDDPVSFAVRDRTSILLGLLAGLAFLASAL